MVFLEDSQLGAAVQKEPRCYKTSGAWNSSKKVQFINSYIHIQKTVETLTPKFPDPIDKKSQVLISIETAINELFSL